MKLTPLKSKRASNTSRHAGRHLPVVLYILIVAALVGGCGGDDGASPGDPAGTGGAGGLDPAVAPFQELYDQGMDRYVGMFSPTASETLDGGVVSHRFSTEGGPICFTGEAFEMSTRDGNGEDLMVFMQGGGACGPNGCDAVESWPPGIPGPLAMMGLLNASDPDNPVRDYDVAYLPYCDGSMWSGDADVDADGDGATDYQFRGLMNLSASIDVIAEAYPAPSRIFLAGNSAGGFGVHHALPILRIHYPDVEIEMINDSGVGISVPGAWEETNAYWNASAMYPESCADCIGADGNLTGFHGYQLDQDPLLRMGFMSTKQDGVVLERLPMSPEAYEAEVVAAMAELEAAHPDRFRSFVANGDGHTFILQDFDREVGGTTPRRWIEDLLNGGAWVSVSD
jgi:hypothetical protein